MYDILSDKLRKLAREIQNKNPFVDNKHSILAIDIDMSHRTFPVVLLRKGIRSRQGVRC